MLGFLQVLSLGGIPYSAKFSDKVHRCASGINSATITKAQYQSTMVARLCLADSVVGLYSLMLEDCAPTQIDDDYSDEFDPDSVVDGIMATQSIVGRLNDTFACYRQLSGDGSPVDDASGSVQ